MPGISEKPLAFDPKNALSEAVGRHGLSGAEAKAMEKRIEKEHAALIAERKAGKFGFANAVHDGAAEEASVRAAEDIAKEFSDLVVLGIGGSALGARALLSALAPAAGKGAKSGRKLRIHIVDNVDPDYVSETFGSLDLRNTAFNVVTKSGSTPETMAQFLIACGMIKKAAPGKLAGRIFVTTDPEKGDLRAISKKEGFRTLPVPPDVGGRYSLFTAVGLLPAAAAGIDVHALMGGAREFDRDWIELKPLENPAYSFAASCHAMHSLRSKPVVVLFSYSQKLYDLADWFRQLWAESLGKRIALDGSEVFAGSTPIRALGTTDQHSQIQLYAEGPNDKFIVFLRVGSPGADVQIPKLYPEMKSLSYLGGHNISELFEAEFIGTEVALREAQRPTARLTLARVDERCAGYAFQMLMASTVFAGRLYNVNPFDQPGVERGKVVAAALLGKEGLEKVRKEIEAVR